MSRQTQQDMHVLMQHFYAKTMPKNGLRYSERLFQITTNYSDERSRTVAADSYQAR